MLKDFSNKNMEETLELVQGFFDDNKSFFVKLKKVKNIYRFTVTANKLHIYLYAMIKDEKVIAIALYVHDRYYLDFPFLSLSYAVVEKYRNKGICSDLVGTTLNVIQDDVKTKSKNKKMYVVTYVSLDNKISQKISKRFISRGSNIITDTITGEKQHEFVKILS